jgi:hypothetical protein
VTAVSFGRRTFWHRLFEELLRFLFLVALKSGKADVVLSNFDVSHGRAHRSRSYTAFQEYEHVFGPGRIAGYFGFRREFHPFERLAAASSLALVLGQP